VRVLLDGRGQHLQTARTIFSLQFAEDLHGIPAVRARSQDEGQHNGVAFVLAQRQGLAICHVDGEIGSPYAANRPPERPAGGEQAAAGRWTGPWRTI